MPLMLGRQGPHCSWDAGQDFPIHLQTGPFTNRAWGRNRGPMMLLMQGRQGPHCSWDAREDFPTHLQTGHGEETEAQ